MDLVLWILISVIFIFIPDMYPQLNTMILLWFSLIGELISMSLYVQLAYGIKEVLILQKQSLQDGAKLVLVSITKIDPFSLKCYGSFVYFMGTKILHDNFSIWPGFLPNFFQPYFNKWMFSVSDPSPHLRKVSLDLIENRYCQNYYPIDDRILPSGVSSTMLCALTPKKDTCFVSISKTKVKLALDKFVREVPRKSNSIILYYLRQDKRDYRRPKAVHPNQFISSLFFFRVTLEGHLR